MKSAFALIVIGLAATGQAEQANPVQKTVELLSSLESKILQEGKDAQKLFAEFSENCEETSANLQYDIKTGKGEVAELKAAIEQETATMNTLNAKIEDLAANIAKSEADLAAATKVRETDSADFAAEEKDLLETINTIERAVAIIEREMSSSGASMLQLRGSTSITQALKTMVEASMFSTADASRLTALVQTSDSSSDDSENMGAPDPTVYENQSGGIVETLNSLKDKAQDQLDAARKAETESLRAYELLKQSLEDSMKFDNKDMSAAKKNLGEAGEAKSTAEGDLEVTAKALAADVKDLADLHGECMKKAQSYEDETKSRGEELKALAEAKKVVKETTGGAESLTYSFTQQSSFLQVARSKASSDVNFKAIRFVRELAHKHGDTALAQLASRMVSAIRFGSTGGEDPFAKVKGLISEMLERLEQEAEADATKQAWCEKETAETETTKAEKSAEIEKLSAKIDSATARNAQLKNEIAAAQKALAELAASQAAMDKLRQEEKAQYDANKPEMEAGLEGVKLALKILNEYYAKEDKAHEAADSTGDSTGIIGLLEVVESDFSKGLAEMVADEESAAAEYDQQTKENEITKATTEKDVEYKTKESAGLEQALAELSSDREGVQSELDAALEYLKKLEDQCIAKPDTYEMRKARREAEIAGLKEALEILSNEAASLIQRKTSRRALRGHA